MSQNFYPTDTQFFNLKIRESYFDWAMLSQAMCYHNQYYTHSAQRAWLFNQVNRFCREIAIPTLRLAQEASQGQLLKVERTIQIQEVCFADSTNSKIISDYAEFKRSTPTKIIRDNILMPAVQQMQRKWIENPNIVSVLPF